MTKSTPAACNHLATAQADLQYAASRTVETFGRFWSDDPQYRAMGLSAYPDAVRHLKRALGRLNAVQELEQKEQQP